MTTTRTHTAPAANPNNLSQRYAEHYLRSPHYAALTPQQRKTFRHCIRSGVQNPDSTVGCYATSASDYVTFAPFFDRVIRAYHHAAPHATHTSGWPKPPPSSTARFNLSALSLPPLSMRVRVARNLSALPLPAGMSRRERVELERRLAPVFARLSAAHGGSVHSLTPDFGRGQAPNATRVCEGVYAQLVRARVMFKPMHGDPYLASGGLAADWPYGRGCWVSGDRTRVVWFGEEDHLRIMCMRTGTDLAGVFDAVRALVGEMEGMGGVDFARHDTYGYVTSCPSNLGTGMRASVHIKVPALLAEVGEKRLSSACKSVGLSVRGVGGEHTAVGEDGTVDVSARERVFVTEQQVLERLYGGIARLSAWEKAAKARRSARLSGNKLCTSWTPT